MTAIFNSNNNFNLQITGAVMTSDFEKLSNHLLSDLNIETTSALKPLYICRQELSINDDIWNVPNPLKSSKKSKMIKEQPPKLNIKGIAPSICKEIVLLNEKSKIEIRIANERNLQIKYFNEWINFTKQNKVKSRNVVNDFNKQNKQQEKLDHFLNKLKKLKSASKQKKTAIKKDTRRRSISSSEKTSQDSSCYEHRFKAQQNIIQSQKEKLVTQEKIIQELKLGKLSGEIEQSLQKTKNEIREIFSNCSLRVKCQVPLLCENRLQLQLTTSKAPKMLQKMEERTLQREERRRLIMERKRILDVQKKEFLEQELNRKRTLEEEEKKRVLKEMRDKREREMKLQNELKIKRQQFLDSCNKADDFRKRKLLQKGFLGFIFLMVIKEENENKSEEFYEQYLMKKSWQTWWNFTTNILNLKCVKAVDLCNSKLERRVLHVWIAAYTDAKKHMQVAEDLYDMNLQSKVLRRWSNYTYAEAIKNAKKLEKAVKHYNNQILLHYFCYWRLWPSIVKMEKLKELKKQKWREKVWEIIPDYTPIIDT